MCELHINLWNVKVPACIWPTPKKKHLAKLGMIKTGSSSLYICISGHDLYGSPRSSTNICNARIAIKRIERKSTKKFCYEILERGNPFFGNLLPWSVYKSVDVGTKIWLKGHSCARVSGKKPIMRAAVMNDMVERETKTNYLNESPP